MKSRHPLRNILVPLLIVVAALSAFDYYNQRSITWHLRLFNKVQEGIGNLQLLRQRQEEAPFIVERSDRAERLPATGQVPAAGFMDTSEPRFELVGRVSDIIDGDSFEVRVDDRDYTVRLYGIDTPEYDQPHGDEASRALSRKLNRHSVAVDIRDIDSYGRLVGIVYYQGENINQAMIAEGHAWWYERYARAERELETAQRAAQEAGLGLWAESNPVAPWDWRREH